MSLMTLPICSTWPATAKLQNAQLSNFIPEVYTLILYITYPDAEMLQTKSFS